MISLLDRPLAIVDVETTGTSYKNGGIIDIGIIRVEGGRAVARYEQLINPGGEIPAFISRLTGIENSDLADAPIFEEVADTVYDLLDEAVFVAHNVRFDYAFVKEEFRRLDYPYSSPLLCTVRLSRQLNSQLCSHRLDALIGHYGIEVSDRHRALPDAEATWQILQKMLSEHPETKLSEVIRQQVRQPSQPVQLPLDELSQLDDGPGVYIFENSQGATLYVGKSIHVRQRVLSHFNQDHRLVKEMNIAQEVAKVRVVPTTGEMGALLKESRLIKELAPIYNRQFRRQKDLVVAVRQKNAAGYDSLRLERGVAQNSLAELGFEHVMAVYKSEKQAKDALLVLTKEHRLCQRLMGLQKSDGGCFAFQLKQCDGACLGHEAAESYNSRFDQAFASSRMESWPFAQAVTIVEQSDDGKRTEYVIDQWSVRAVRDEQGRRQDWPVGFDWDEYKILKKFV